MAFQSPILVLEQVGNGWPLNLIPCLIQILFGACFNVLVTFHTTGGILSLNHRLPPSPKTPSFFYTCHMFLLALLWATKLCCSHGLYVDNSYDVCNILFEYNKLIWDCIFKTIFFSCFSTPSLLKTLEMLLDAEIRIHCPQ